MEDVERLFSLPLMEWMEKKGYSNEALYLRVVQNWRRACDEQGLTGDQCSQLKIEFLCRGIKMVSAISAVWK